MEGSSGGAGGNANSSDFVRKLYKMLENPSDESVVRWGDAGDSFVVLENEKFTKHILPKHFKHSNFASFVRQLNKYDFHKVRHNNEEGGGSPYGPGAWEFKHPDFKANNKDALDNIRRKAPAARKPQAPTEDMLVPTQQMDMLNGQLVAMQTQVQTLEKQNQELSLSNQMMIQELMALQKFVTNHEHVLQNVVRALNEQDARRRRESRILFSGSSDVGGQSTLATANSLPTIEDDTPPSPLQHASKLLNETNVDLLMNTRNLEHMSDLASRMNNGGLPSPPDMNGRGSTGSAPPSAGSTGHIRFAELDQLVYPVGANNGINPMYPEHAHNIPYALGERHLEQPLQAVPSKKSETLDPGWARVPEILLVEDDAMCRRIGAKFLSAYRCNVTAAHDGLQAVEKQRDGKQFDLILMDIIMPNLDGCSATHFLRQNDSTTPIVAMTSNIRSDDIAAYYGHGMNDILPKPFTKEGLLQVLEKHLYHLKKNAQHLDPLSAPSTAGLRPDIKAEDSPLKSPATSSNWHSPSNVPGMSPAASTGRTDEYGIPVGGPGAGLYNMQTNSSMLGHVNPNGIPYTPTAPHRRHISEISGGDDMASAAAKRQQMYAPMSQLGQMGPRR